MLQIADDVCLLRAERDFLRRLLALSVQDELKPLIAEALELIVQVTFAQQAYIELRERTDDGEPVYSIAHSLDELDLASVRASISRGIIAESLATGHTILTASALLDPRFCSRSSVKRHEIQAVLCAPIGSSALLGAVYLQGRSQPGPFTREDQARVELLARQLAPLAARLVTEARSERNIDATAHVRAHFRCSEILGRSRALAELLEQAALVSPLALDLLLTGPSGTGKSALARVIAANSQLRDGPFVELNCAALPESLLESELFGAERGAHSTAHRNLPGKLAAAEGGTLFLDEIAELAPGAQAKLLQLLQSGVYYPLGATTAVTANVRVISATHVDLQEAVAAKRFREDLFYRLHVMPLRVPSLAERRDDIDLLVEHFARQAATRHRLSVHGASRASLARCREATWPGNVRQVAHAVEAAVVRAHGEGSPFVEPHHVFPGEREGEGVVHTSFQAATRRFQRELLVDTLERNEWNVSAAARSLELTRSHLYNLIEAHQLSRSAALATARPALASEAPSCRR